MADHFRAGTAKLHLAVNIDVKLSKPGGQTGWFFAGGVEILPKIIKSGMRVQEIRIGQKFVTFKFYIQGLGLFLIQGIPVKEFLMHVFVPLFAEEKAEVPLFEENASDGKTVRGQRREPDRCHAAIMGELENIRNFVYVFFHDDKAEPEFVIFAPALAFFDKMRDPGDDVFEVFAHDFAIGRRPPCMNGEADRELRLQKEIGHGGGQMKACRIHVANEIMADRLANEIVQISQQRFTQSMHAEIFQVGKIRLDFFKQGGWHFYGRGRIMGDFAHAAGGVTAPDGLEMQGGRLGGKPCFSGRRFFEQDFGVFFHRENECGIIFYRTLIL